MADERRAMAAMDTIRKANRHNAMRVARAASVAAEEAVAMAEEEATALEMTQQCALAAVGTLGRSDGGTTALEECHVRR
jgi:UTP:GlnB (protein PII) uridylyltransferase